METVPYPGVVCPRCLREVFLLHAGEAQNPDDILVCRVHGDVMTREEADKKIQRRPAPYVLVRREDHGPSDREGTWLIERPMRNAPPVRIRFLGTRKRAQAKVDQLNALAAEGEK